MITSIKSIKKIKRPIYFICTMLLGISCSIHAAFAHTDPANHTRSLTEKTTSIVGANAMDFDGIDDYISIPDHSSLDLTVADDITLEFWFKTSATAYNPIINKFDTANDWTGYGVSTWPDGKIAIAKISVWTGDANQIYTSAAGFNDGQWHHFVGLMPGTDVNDFEIYVDGILQATTVDYSSLSGSITNNVPLVIGRADASYYTGSLDEIRVWNVIKSCEEINNNKDCELTGLEANLQLYYNFNEGTPDNDNSGIVSIDDASPNSNVGTPIGFTLNGSSSNFISATNGVTGTCSGGSSAAPEINVLGMGMNILNGDNSPNELDGTDYGLIPVNTSEINTFNIQNTGTTDLEITAIQLSNALVFSLPMGLSFPIVITPSTSFDLDITYLASNAGLYQDQVTILSDDCNEGTYTFNLIGKDAIEDEDALHFDGIDDHISVPFVAPNTSSMTVEAWVQITSGDENSRTIISWCDQDGNQSFQIRAWSHFIYYQERSSNGFIQRASFVPGGDGWHHIAVVRTSASTNNILLYVDGVLSGPDVTGGSFSGLDVINIGKVVYFNNSSQYFLGAMDEIRVWDYDRCIEEILNDKDCKLTGTEPGLQLYFDFNEGTGDGDNTGLTMLEEIANNNDGTLQNFTLNGSNSNFIESTHDVVGSCSATSISDIKVSGLDIEIRTEDDTPSETDNTDYGLVPPNTLKTNTFKIENIGLTDLEITAIQLDNTTAFSLPAGLTLPMTLSSNANFDLDIAYLAPNAGIYEAQVTILSDDCNEATYIFDLIGKDAIPNEDALDFDGTDDYADIPFVTPHVDAMTIEAWIQIDQNDSQNRTILSWSDGVNNNEYMQLYSSGSYLYFEANTPASYTTLSSAPINENGWHHIAVVKKATATDNLQLYVDGVLSRSSTLVVDVTNMDALTLGGLKRYNNYSNYYKGTMDELRVWNYDRCIEEIIAQKDCELTGTETGLELYYNFNEGLTDGDNTAMLTVADSSPSNANGTLNNFILSGTNSNFIGATNGVRGTCSELVLPEINILGNSMNISTGDDSPDLTDDTHFGIVALGNSTMHTFSIENTGAADLNITAIQLDNTNAFSLPALSLPMVIAPNMSFDLDITYAPQLEGINNTVVTITNDDCSETIYTFQLRGGDCSTAYELSGVPSKFCPGETNGSIDLSVTPIAGDPNYTVAWSNLETTEDLMNLGLGTYTVSVTETAGQSCMVTKSFDIKEHLLPEYNAATLTINDICKNDYSSSQINELPYQNFEISTVLPAAFLEDLADFDNDQQVDLLYSTSTSLYWVPGIGGNSFGTPILIDDALHSSNIFTGRAKIGDMNGDLKPDIVANSNLGTLYWYENDGAGNFTKHTISSTNNAGDIVLMDIDGQNGLDIFLGSGLNGSSHMSWHENDGTGNFTSYGILTSTSPGGNTFSPIPIDFDRDNDMDFLYRDRVGQGERLRVLINDGNQNFTDQLIATESDYNFLGLSAKDLDGDNWADIAYARETFSNYEVVWMQNENAVFSDAVKLYSIGSTIQTLNFADWDGDGAEDIFVGINGRIVVLKKIGTAIYEVAASLYDAGTTFLRMHLYDLDDDGGIEVFVNQLFGSDEVKYLEDLAITKNPFDFNYNFNGGGNLVFEDVSQNFGTAYPYLTNISHDGMVTMNITEITDATGCPITMNISDDFNRITFDINAVVTPTDICAVNNDGAIDLSATVTGSTNALTYSWSNMEMTEDLMNLDDGNYRVTVSEGSCIQIENYDVGDREAPVAQAKDISVYLNGAPDITVAGTDIDDNSTDNCSIATYDCALAGGGACTFTATGNYDVVLTVTDDAGLQHTATASVEVLDAPLAIDGLDFTAQIIGQQSYLQWFSAQSNVREYHIYWSSPSSPNWEKVGKITTNNTKQQYDFWHTEPTGGVNYYRLQQIDLSNRTEYSQVISLDFQTIKDLKDWTVHPNPTSGIVYVQLPNTTSIKNIMVYDKLGRLVKTSPANLGFISLENLVSGLYILVIENEGKRYQRRVVKE